MRIEVEISLWVGVVVEKLHERDSTMSDFVYF